MASIYETELSCHQIQNTFKSSDKQTFTIRLTKKIIYRRENLPQISSWCGMILDKRFSNDHKERCRNTFSRYIGHNNCQMCLIHHEEIVKITANFLCRCHSCINIKFLTIRKSRENTWQHGCLNIPGDIQLSADSLLLSSHFGQIGNVIFKLFHHKVERVT